MQAESRIRALPLTSHLDLSVVILASGVHDEENPRNIVNLLNNEIKHR